MKILKTIYVLIIVACSVVSFLGVSTKQTEQSDFLLRNVEALAGGEWLPEVEIVCGAEGGNCWKTTEDCKVGWFHYAPDCIFTGLMENYCLSACGNN
jgi:hypothetical protein